VTSDLIRKGIEEAKINAELRAEIAQLKQRTWVGLTDAEIDAIYLQHHNQYGECESPNWGYERAIQNKLKEKNNG
jgi:hypothetical protein